MTTATERTSGTILWRDGTTLWRETADGNWIEIGHFCDAVVATIAALEDSRRESVRYKFREHHRMAAGEPDRIVQTRDGRWWTIEG